MRKGCLSTQAGALTSSVCVSLNQIQAEGTWARLSASGHANVESKSKEIEGCHRITGGKKTNKFLKITKGFAQLKLEEASFCKCRQLDIEEAFYSEIVRFVLLTSDWFVKAIQHCGNDLLNLSSSHTLQKNQKSIQCTMNTNFNNVTGANKWKCPASAFNMVFFLRLFFPSHTEGKQSF